MNKHKTRPEEVGMTGDKRGTKPLENTPYYISPPAAPSVMTVKVLKSVIDLHAIFQDVLNQLESHADVLALVTKAEILSHGIQNNAIRQMINDLINPLRAVKMFSAATWPSLTESMRPSFEEFREKLEVMIHGLNHWPARRCRSSKDSRQLTLT